uniref:Protein lin 9 n=1 Tax=Echinococcus granulosus TaxID=6210 RepID=A0A068WA81_ECHGR|nr:protein lin 9 [Echinococcus granulosus]
MNGMDNSEITNPVILEASNPPSVMHYGNVYKTKTTELCDQSDAMSDFLFSLVKMERILEKKQKAVAVLKGMNETVESQVSAESSPVTPEFQHKYATLILHLDELNQELKYHIGIVLHHITEIAGDYGMQDVILVTDWRRRCEDEAYEIVNRLKSSQGSSTVDESKFILVAKLTTILTLLSHLQENRMSNSELSCIEEVFADIRQHLHPSNLKCFEQSVEQLISHIVLNLSPSILPMSTSNAASAPSNNNVNPTEPPYPGHSAG